MDGRGGQKIQLESVKETKKRNSFCLIVVKRKGARCHFSFKPMGPTLPDVLIPLELAISACQKKAMPGEIRLESQAKQLQKCSKTKCLPDYVCVVFIVCFSMPLL